MLDKINLEWLHSIGDCKQKIVSWLKDPLILPQDKDEIIDLIRLKNKQELQDRFYQDLEFGTGGMRGIMGMGNNRMNRYVVRRVVQGFANYILSQGDIHFRKRGVAIAYDSRIHSYLFAQEAASVLAANGICVFIYPTAETTPALSFAIRKLNCIAGLCITASHNPSQYNGMKVYWEDGAQIIAPQDAGILKEVFALSNFCDAKFLNYHLAEQKGYVQLIKEEVLTSYFEELKKLSVSKILNKKISLVFTPLHGTGKKPALRALKSWGYENVFVVPEQAEPDGNFPTVTKPNPEEPEALALAVHYAKEKKADALFATDPDSDRLALAVYDPQMSHGLMKHQACGDFVLLNGNQTGALLIDYILKSMTFSETLKKNHKIIKTIVTSDLHSRICQSYGIEIANTLTGFKWIAGLIRSWELKNLPNEYLFGTEESFGFMPSNHVRDKDAIASLCLATEMLAFLKQNHYSSACQYLFELFKKHGAWQEDLVSIDLYGEQGTKRIQRIMNQVRLAAPKTLAGKEVLQILDYKQSEVQQQYQIPSSNVIQILLNDGSKVSLRPSGTEPKLKLYFSACTLENPVEPAYLKSVQKIALLRNEMKLLVSSID